MEYKYFCGLPMEEAIKVLEYYKYLNTVPSNDYIKGFEDGLKAAYEECNKQIQNALWNQLGINTDPDQVSDNI